MCGIIGFTGRKQATEILLRGLEALEYRGYDSAGISVMTKDGPVTVKRPGRVAELCSVVAERGGIEGTWVSVTPAGLPTASRVKRTRTRTSQTRSCSFTTASSKTISICAAS